MDNFDKTLEEELDKFGKMLIEEIGHVIKSVGKQFTLTSSAGGMTNKVQECTFTDDFYKEARKQKLTKADAIDVYRNGYKVGKDEIIREYNGYEIGIEYEIDSEKGIPVIDSIWKKVY